MDAAEPLLPGRRRRPLDHRGRPASSSATGGWRSAYYVLGVEVLERVGFYGTSSNLITYLTGPLRQPTASAAAGVNAWLGVASMLPLLGGSLADSSLGRYSAVLLASALYLVGLSLLTLSAVLPTFGLQQYSTKSDPSPSPSSLRLGLVFSAIYIIALGMGFHKPCAQAFAADQFDENDPEERRHKSSFFNWWYFAMSVGGTCSFLFLSYIQENIGWGLGFGIPCFAIAISLMIFLLGTRTYRYYTSPIQFTDKVQASIEVSSFTMQENEMRDGVQAQLKAVLKLLPIWASGLMYAVVFAQTTTLFTKQGSTVDRRIGEHFQVPPAALLSFLSITIIVFILIYDQVFVPVARKITGLSSGITMLQRIGVGLFLAVVSMVFAALVEMKRLETARDHGVVDNPGAMIPMSLWWFVPQYVVFGMAETFTMVGWQEFFYDQVPDSLRSIGLSLYLSILSLGSFISSLLITLIDRVSSSRGDSWFADNLNRAHIDYFYWLLAALNLLGFVLFLYFSVSYKYKSKGVSFM